MPVQVFGPEDVEKILVANPNMRFATTFLSNKYRKYSVNGETLQDKATGEIFTRRPEDGRVVSFFQNKKYMYDLMLELKILLNSNDTFKYPDETNIGAFYVSTDYDLICVNNDEIINVLEEDTVIKNDVQNYHNVSFLISDKSSGFFVRVTPRDSDKAAINYLTTEYNNVTKNYSGTDEEFIAEKEKFHDITNWGNCNATINYTISFEYEGETVSYTLDDYVNISEEMAITIPETIIDKYFEKESPKIVINSISYPKLQFMYSHMTTDEENELKKYLYPDNQININYLNVMTFVNDSSDILIHSNEFIVAMVDVPYCIRYMNKVAEIVTTEHIKLILSPTRPNSTVWVEGGIWAEEVRNVYSGGIEVDKNSETAIEEFERLISPLSPDVLDPYDVKIAYEVEDD